MTIEQVEQKLVDAGYIVEIGWFRGMHFVVTLSNRIVSVMEVQALFNDYNVECNRNNYLYSVAVFVY